MRIKEEVVKKEYKGFARNAKTRCPEYRQEEFAVTYDN